MNHDATNENAADREEDAAQHPHTPGQDPQGSGEARDAETPTGREDAPERSPVAPESQRDAAVGGLAAGAAAAGAHTGAPEDNPEHNTAPDGRSGIGGDAPLGGDRTTEEQLQADTAVEQDALRALDPDDSPA